MTRLNMNRRAAQVEPVQLVHHEPLDATAVLPLIVRPACEDVNLQEWVRRELAWIKKSLDRHGAILFRGFPITTPTAFQEVAAEIAGELFGEYGDLPPNGGAERIYQSTPYPPEEAILFHNESSHLPLWPMLQFFGCMKPSPTGGDTPLLDCREAYRLLDPEMRAAFETKGLTYVRNFHPGLDVSWQQFFRTTDRAEVQQRCLRDGIEIEWLEDDRLRLLNRRPAVKTHPRTGEKVFFNQIQLHHVACLPVKTRESLAKICRPEEFPRQVLFGDGSPIPDEWMERITALYWSICRRFPWQTGDMILVDNLLTGHARMPYEGPRLIVVAMGDMVNDSATALPQALTHE